MADALSDGGAQQVMFSLTRWTLDRGHTTSVFARPGIASSGLDARAGFHEKPAGGFARETAALLRLCRRVRPDVLHAHQRRDALASLAVGRALGIPVVEHAHTLLPDRGVAALSFRSDHIFAVSAQVAHMLESDFAVAPERVTMIGNPPVQTDRRPPVPPAPLTEGRALRVIGVGRLVDQKDPQRFVRVMRSIAALRPVSARWLGVGEQHDACRDLAQRIAAPVEFPGQSDRVVDELDDADCLVMTSRWEGMPLAILEAFARCRPVIATRAATGGLLDDGRGFVVDDDLSDDDFARHVVAVMRDHRATAHSTARAARYLDENASPDRVFAPVLAAYERLARRRQRHGR